MPDFVQKVDIPASAELFKLERAIQLAMIPLHPFAKGDLSATGWQTSAEVTTDSADWKAVEIASIDFGITADIIEVEFALSMRIKSTGATKDVLYKWQARNTGGTWIDLMPEQTKAASAAAYETFTWSGRCAICAEFGKMPFQVQLLIKREDATENAVAQIFGSSYIAVTV